MSRLFFALMLAACGMAAWAGIVPNPGFESGAGGTLSSWTLNPQTPIADTPDSVANASGDRVIWDKSSTPGGTRCLKMITPGRLDTNFTTVHSSPLRLVPGYSYVISFSYRASGLLPENGDRSQYASIILDLGCQGARGQLGNTRFNINTNSDGWVTVDKTLTVPAGTVRSQISIGLRNKYPNSTAYAWCDDIRILPEDPTLINPNFENGADAPEAWLPIGAAKVARVQDVAYQSRYAVSVSDAPDGLFSGYATEVPVREDRTYRFSGYVKGGDLAPDGFIGGGALCLQYLDAEGQPIGKPVISPAVPANTHWTQVSTPRTQAPLGATAARLTVGLQYCRGTAWFDNLSLIVDVAESPTAPRVKRTTPQRDPAVHYATNLLANGDVETGTDGRPAGWSYVGKSEANWTAEEITRLHTDGRPLFSIGRGRGEWSQDTTYAGEGALLNISIDPPLSRNHQWYGRNPVDGYWISDPMPCTPGQAYLAGGWVRPGAIVSNAWYGPLELQFFDARGKQLKPQNNIRCATGYMPAGAWNYLATMPHIAPEKAVTMRLRFGQEFKADSGGWGRTYADNLAVWALPAGASVPGQSEVSGSTERFRSWFRATHATVRPPYQPAPAEAVGYESCWGRMENAVPGSLYTTPKAPVQATFTITNILGEPRTLSLRMLRTDWQGKASAPITVPAFRVNGASDIRLPVTLPPTNAYGAYHLDVEILEGQVVMGRFTGRYAVMPPLNRPRTTEAVWGVTPLVPISGTETAFQRELGQVLRVAGYGIAWVRMDFPLDPAKRDQEIAEAVKIADWYRKLGIRPVLQLHPEWKRPVDRAAYEAAGRAIGVAFKGKVAAIGNHGIEQANSASPYRGGGAARLTDVDYDTILAGLYDGIKAVDPQQTVLIGNIATDWEAKTVRRLYGAPAEGRFDGAILNAYMGLVMTAQNNVKEFDKHGDTRKNVWMEENANQRSPFEGEARRYGEADGSKNMVRTWLSLAALIQPRLRAVTTWGFVTNVDQDINIMTSNLQPRPQYVAHAVMADALADAKFIADRSQGDVTLFEWRRGDGPVFAAWANAGDRDVTLEVTAGKLTMMDLMGNRTVLTAKNRILTVHLSTTPVYLFGGGAVTVSRRLEVRLSHGDTHAGKPQIRLEVKNNDKTAMAGSINLFGEITGAAQRTFALKPGERMQLTIPVSTVLGEGKASQFRAECRTKSGAVYTATAAFNFAQAVRVTTPPALDGTWKEWAAAPVVAFGTGDQVVKPTAPDEQYTGPSDISGKMRLLWDETYLYLGVEALDNAFTPQPERGSSGFMGDSIEFGIQPDALHATLAPYYEYECYLPGGTGEAAASRRFPLPAQRIEGWRMTVTPTGDRGNVYYQIAIPWADLGVKQPALGKTISLALVLNDTDLPTRLSGNRGRIRWFQGVDGAKNSEGFGDITLVAPSAPGINVR